MDELVNIRVSVCNLAYNKDFVYLEYLRVRSQNITKCHNLF